MNNFINFGTFNINGLRSNSQESDIVSPLKLKNLVNDIQNYNLDVCCLQETHISDHCELLVISENKTTYSFINIPTRNRHHGIGFIIKNSISFTYRVIHDNLASVLIKLPNKKGHHTIEIFNVYIPWDPHHPYVKELYNILNSEFKSNRKNKFVCGDFNASLSSYENIN